MNLDVVIIHIDVDRRDDDDRRNSRVAYEMLDVEPQPRTRIVEDDDLRIADGQHVVLVQLATVQERTTVEPHGPASAGFRRGPPVRLAPFDEEHGARRRARHDDIGPFGSDRQCHAERAFARRFLYPDVRVELILSNEELDLAMREADVAIRLRRPAQPDLIQRRLFTVHFHVYASADYLKRFGEPKTLEDLDEHRIVSFGGDQPSYLMAVHWLSTAGREGREPRQYHYVVNNITALKLAVETGAGIAVLPDYAVVGNPDLVQILRDVEMPSLDSYLVYAEEMRSVARVQAFRDFLISKAQRWNF